MDTFNTQNTVSTKVTQLVESIANTCDALISALEVNAQSVGSYGGGVLQHFDSEFVDRVVKALLKIKYHTIKLDKELKNGLISSQEELELIVSGLLQTVDGLDTILLEDGFMRNQFSFLVEEVKTTIQELLEHIKIGSVA